MEGFEHFRVGHRRVPGDRHELGLEAVRPDVLLEVLQYVDRDGLDPLRGLGDGLGLGLGGAKRLSNEFKIDTAVGKGTRVTIARWK